MKLDTKTILIVDDEELSRDAITAGLQGSEYRILSAANGKAAMEVIRNESIDLVLTDLKMPEMDGFELIEQIRKLESRPVVLVQTVIQEIDTVVQLMRSGVYDYITKPLSIEGLRNRIKNALEHKEFLSMKETLEKERQLRIQSQLDWNLWRMEMIRKEEQKEDNSLIDNIRTSLSQGTGFGSLISVIQILKSKAVEKEKSYEIDKKLMEMLLSNAESAEKIIDVFEEIDSLSHNPLKLQNLSITDLYDLLNESLEDLKSYFENSSIHIAVPKNNFSDRTEKIPIDKAKVQSAFRELGFNAIKFSQKDSTLYILLQLDKDNYTISFLNRPVKDQKGNFGILPEYQNLIFEPFFRISKFVYESVPTLDFGLGLTLVEKIMSVHRGKVRAFNVRNSLDQNTDGILVNMELVFPLRKA